MSILVSIERRIRLLMRQDGAKGRVISASLVVQTGLNGKRIRMRLSRLRHLLLRVVGVH